jgi:homoserine O-acetyltransferase/O-succinyltransferase
MRRRLYILAALSPQAGVRYAVLVAAALIAGPTSSRAQSTKRPTTEGDYVARDFQFRSGEKLPELRLHYTTIGKAAHDGQGRISNAVLILHGTGGTGRQFLAPQFADELYGPGQPLDAARYYIILPDGLGHGKSSKPSDGLRMHFPSYDYDDMVAAQHLLLTKGLGIEHLRLIFGTSMGCMHSFVWGETYPAFMDALMPMACLPVQIAGRNRLWRKMAMDAITSDPEWNGGEYKTQPKQGLRMWLDFLLIAGSAPHQMQKDLPTRDAADAFLADQQSRLTAFDANDILYYVNASRNYNPSPALDKITAQVMWINSADDFINPPELGIAEREAKRLNNGRFVLLPTGENTHGHGTHTWAVNWKQYLEGVLTEAK